ncbi:MAG: tRNA (guanosine(46)-N7)-methyltransferase TrmB [Ruminococcus sp.]|nr:tRNA (guanosine(46)-N7)-methyltransferase TrmB [Ruminococcus sp.]
MRIRKKKWAEPELSVCDFYVEEPKLYKNRWSSFFNNDKPIMLEVGCGKGSFVGQMAILNPDINFIAVDIKLDMLGVGRRNIVELFSDENRAVDNIALVRYNVEMLDEIIGADDNIQRIYINFCNPWPREKHKKRRLTHPRKLKLYRELLPKGNEIHFKTDDDELFSESLEYFKSENFGLKEISYDLHNSGIDSKTTPMTEHEKMFSDEGIKIKYCIVKNEGKDVL